MNIYTYGYKSLKTKSIKLEEKEINDDLRAILDNMVKTMREARGCGLAANQVGIEKRFFVLEIENQVKKIINPEIIEFSEDRCSMEEGCLSIPGIYKEVVRPTKIKIKYLDENGNKVEEELDGMWSRAFQHEYDHIDGVLFVEKISPVAKNLIRKKLETMKKAKLVREFE